MNWKKMKTFYFMPTTLRIWFQLGFVPTGDGISEMKVDPQKDAKSWKAFNVCMDDIIKAVPTEKHKTTPLFLGATAGMRLLQ